MTSRDGYCWTKKGGLKAGVPTIGLISPPNNISNSNVNYDVVVIGAGYCGLTAARNAAVEGLRVLLLEGRDRIGGRSWSTDLDGYSYEMGGTWVHWGQSNTWREMMRYEMQGDVENSFDFSRGYNQFELNSSAVAASLSHEEEDELLISGMKKFTNVDGVYGRKVMPLPHDTFHTEQAKELDRLSAKDRIDQIAADLTPKERAVLEPFILLFSGSTLEKTSFHEVMHWWAMCGYRYEGCIDMLISWKFKRGQSSFAIRFFEEALETKRLSYAFNSAVKTVKDTGSGIEVTVDSGKKYQATRAISAIPLNVINEVTWDPPLSSGKKAASAIGNINQTIKVHAEISDKDLRSWTGITWPQNELIYAIGDGTTPAGNTHIVCFGGDHKHMHPEEDIERTKHVVENMFLPKEKKPEIERLVFHNWSKDEFAKGAWFFSPPGLLVDHLDDMRARHGNIIFANSDWALGWRSFIDGAIEEGTRAALEVRREWASSQPGAISLR